MRNPLNSMLGSMEILVYHQWSKRPKVPMPNWRLLGWTYSTASRPTSCLQTSFKAIVKYKNDWAEIRMQNPQRQYPRHLLYGRPWFCLCEMPGESLTSLPKSCDNWKYKRRTHPYGVNFRQ